MAHLNIEWRRYAVWEQMQAGVTFNRLALLRLAVEYGCTIGAIHFDMKMIAKDKEKPVAISKAPHPKPDGPAWDRTCLAVLERDNCRCAYCGCEAFDIDHIIPRSAGGKDEVSNLVAACKPCNSRKGRQPLNLFNPVLQERATTRPARRRRRKKSQAKGRNAT